MNSRLTQPSRPMLVFAAAFLGWMFDGMEMGIFPLVARPALSGMAQAQGIVEKPAVEAFVVSWMGWITALFLLGAAAGGLLFGWLGDKIGRVRAMTASILCYSVFAGLAYFAKEPWQLGGLRFLGALGMGGEWSLGVALVMEVWPENKRPLMAGLIGAAANLGYCLIALVAVGFKVTQDSWRWVMLVGAAPAALTFVIRMFVPESEKWVASQKKGASSPVREVFGAALLGRTLLGVSLASVALVATWGVVQWIPLWADQMTGGQVPTAKAWSQFAQSLGASVGSFVAAVVGIRFGRRGTYAVLCVLSFAVCQWLFRGFDSYGLVFLTVVFLVGCCTASFYGWLPLYLPELFPTRVRATGQGVAFNTGRILAAVGAVQAGQVVQWLGGDYARAGAAIVAVYFVGLICIRFAPETRGKPLPE